MIRHRANLTRVDPEMWRHLLAELLVIDPADFVGAHDLMNRALGRVVKLAPARRNLRNLTGVLPVLADAHQHATQIEADEADGGHFRFWIADFGFARRIST